MILHQSLIGRHQFLNIEQWHHHTTLFLPTPTYGGKSTLTKESLFFTGIEILSDPKKS
jgi:hypothetical protein